MTKASDTIDPGRVEPTEVPPEAGSPSITIEARYDPEARSDITMAMVEALGPSSGDCDIVDYTAIAAMVDTTAGTVRSWRNRYPDFPEPFAKLRIGPVWLRDDIEAWLASRGKR